MTLKLQAERQIFQTLTWNFGDDSDDVTTTTEQLQVEHKFPTDGTFHVTVTAANEQGEDSIR